MRSLPALTAAVIAGLVLVVSAVAGASHVRPKGATPLRVSLVPAYKQCTTPNSTHGAPLASPSCTPPQCTSIALTVGTPDVNGAAVNMVGNFSVRALTADVGFTMTVTDVRACLRCPHRFARAQTPRMDRTTPATDSCPCLAA